MARALASKTGFLTTTSCPARDVPNQIVHIFSYIPTYDFVQLIFDIFFLFQVSNRLPTRAHNTTYVPTWLVFTVGATRPRTSSKSVVFSGGSSCIMTARREINCGRRNTNGRGNIYGNARMGNRCTQRRYWYLYYNVFVEVSDDDVQVVYTYA